MRRVWWVAAVAVFVFASFSLWYVLALHNPEHVTEIETELPTHRTPTNSTLNDVISAGDINEEDGVASSPRKADSAEAEGNAAIPLSDSEIVAKELSVFRDAYSDYLKRVESLPDGLQMSSANKGAMGLDEQLRLTLCRLMNTLHSFKDTKDYSAQFVVWEGINDEIHARDGIAEIMGGDSEEVSDSASPKPTILYKHIVSESRGELIVCQNVLIVKQAGALYRLRFVPYALTRTEHDYSVSKLSPPLSDNEWVPWVSENVWMIVDTYEIDAALPSVALIQGPYGGGGYVYFNICSHRNGTWEVARVLEYDGIGAWKYDAVSHVLSLATESDTPATFQVQITANLISSSQNTSP